VDCPSPSYLRNAKYDILNDVHPTRSDNLQPDFIWPSKPPRSHIYAPTTNLITHPLVSPVSSKEWPSDSPPLFFAYGQECMLDEGSFMAKQAFRAGASVQFHQYNALPHIFAFFAQIPQAAHLFAQWAKFCRDCVETPKAMVSSRYKVYEPITDSPGFKAVPHDIGDGSGFNNLAYGQVLEMIDEKKKEMKVWNGPKRSSSL
jgi:hypothetical protein